MPTSANAPDPLDGIQIIDCDAHFTEPPDLWSSRAPASLRDRMPTQRTIDGITGWFLGDEAWASTGGNTISRGPQKNLGTHVVHPFEDVDPSAYEVPARLALMDQIGVGAQVVYPNGVGFASNHVHAIEDTDLRTAVLQTYNDFYVDLQRESEGRLLPQAILPVWDMDLTIKEMTRLLDKGMTGFTLSDKPELLGLPELPRPYWDPMWDLFNESGAVVNFHIGSGATREDIEALRGGKDQVDPDAGVKKINPAWNSFERQRRLAVHATQMYMSNVRIICNLIMSDLFDRYPNLHIVSAESGIGWVPFILEAAEWQLDEMVTRPEEINLTQRRPTDYFRDHIYVMFWFESHAPQTMIEKIGVNNVLVETDIPHPTCLYPGAREHFAKVLDGVDRNVMERVLHDNAAELYGIDRW